jgi:hypothetical protein
VADTDITLTPARLAVLKGVSDGEIQHLRRWGRDPDEDVWRPATGGRKKVKAAVDYLRKAGLIVTGPALHASMYAPQPWQLTSAGESFLAEQGGARP